MSHYEIDARLLVPPTTVQTPENIQNDLLQAVHVPVQGPNIVIENETSPQFSERTQYCIEYFEYPRDKRDPGIILIFNHDRYAQKIPPRRGSTRDVNEIIICMQRLGYNIHSNNICTNFTRDEILQKIDKVLNDKIGLSETNSLIVFFLTHGDDYEQLDVYDRTMKTNEIWEKFASCEELENTPKMFVFQACKGENWTSTNDGGAKEITDIIKPSPIVELNTYSAKHMKPDMLVVYSTLEGNAAFRDPLAGSWFIQELCKNFSAYGRRDDVLSLLTRTTKCVCGNYFNQHEDFGVQKQMPVFVSTLTRKFYLNRNKDRAILIQIQQTNKEILKNLEEIKKKLDEIVDEKAKKKR